jgi:hypothetical protein
MWPTSSQCCHVAAGKNYNCRCQALTCLTFLANTSPLLSVGTRFGFPFKMMPWSMSLPAALSESRLLTQIYIETALAHQAQSEFDITHTAHTL